MKPQRFCEPVTECVFCSVSEGGAKDAQGAEGVFRSAGERRAAGSGSRRESHRQISGKSHLASQSGAELSVILIVTL